MRPRDLAVVAAVVLVAAIAAVDAVRPDAPARAPAAIPSTVPAPPERVSAHVRELMKSDVALQAVRAPRQYCRTRETAVLCFSDRR